MQPNLVEKAAKTNTLVTLLSLGPSLRLASADGVPYDVEISRSLWLEYLQRLAWIHLDDGSVVAPNSDFDIDRCDSLTQAVLNKLQTISGGWFLDGESESDDDNVDDDDDDNDDNDNDIIETLDDVEIQKFQRLSVDTLYQMFSEEQLQQIASRYKSEESDNDSDSEEETIVATRVLNNVYDNGGGWVDSNTGIDAEKTALNQCATIVNKYLRRSDVRAAECDKHRSCRQLRAGNAFLGHLFWLNSDSETYASHDLQWNREDNQPPGKYTYFLFCSNISSNLY
jgi:hypothetical protein